MNTQHSERLVVISYPHVLGLCGILAETMHVN